MFDVDKFLKKKLNIVFLLVVLFCASVVLRLFVFPQPLFSPGGGTSSYSGVFFIFVILVIAVGVVLLFKYKKKI